jgi:hypothetical protein
VSSTSGSQKLSFRHDHGREGGGVLVLLEKNCTLQEIFLPQIPAQKYFLWCLESVRLPLFCSSLLDYSEYFSFWLEDWRAGGYDVAVCKAAVTREHGFFE